MKTRIITGLIYFIFLAGILVLNVPIVDTILVIALSLLGVYEYMKAFKTAGYNPISWIGYLGCLTLFSMGGLVENADKILCIRIALPAVIICVFSYAILTNLKFNILDIMITCFSLVLIPFMFSFIKLILMMNNGRLLIWYVLAGAFASDIFAYFVGSKFGKRKLCPDISPKKTVEGSVAGIIGVVITYIIITVVANTYFDFNFNMWIMCAAAVIIAIVGQFGDLTASAIKRFCKIKDFGSIMPGHGGILDRFDSVMFVAPVVYILFKVYMGL